MSYSRTLHRAIDNQALSRALSAIKARQQIQRSHPMRVERPSPEEPMVATNPKLNTAKGSQ